MNENVLREILTEICEEEIEELNKFLPFKPSLRHRYAMKRIFSSFEKSRRQTKNKPLRTLAAQSRPLRLTTKLVIIIALIVCAALLTGFIIVYISKNFHGKINDDNTQLFAINTENCPTTIEYEYYLSELPEGFEMVNHDISSFYVFIEYRDELSDKTIIFYQSTKSQYNKHYNTEDYNFEEIMINDRNGLFLDFTNNERNGSILVWDNGDYILELSGNLPKNYFVALAKNTKIFEN